MQDFYNINIIPKILKTFKINNLIVSGIKDANLINIILKYDAKFSQINTNDSNCIKGNPLDVLPNLKNYDAIFISDDSNWYTVFNELKIIKETNEEFPLVFICNNTFPNKRRDSYSNPNIIPAKFRQKYTKELPVCHNNEKIVISDGFFHAYEENTPQNGVLTAIEDFLNENSYIGMMEINFIKEICILYPKSQINQKRISVIFKDIQNDKIDEINISDKLLENQLLISYIDEYKLYNENLIDLNVEISRKNVIIDDYENKIRIYDDELAFKDSQINGFQSKLSLKDSQIKNIESKLFNKDKKINNLKNQLSSVNKKFLDLNQEVDDKMEEINDNFESQLDDANKNLNLLNREIDNKDIKINELTNNLKQKESEYINQVHLLNHELNQKEQNLSIIKNKYAGLIKIKDNEIKLSKNNFKQKESNYIDQIHLLNHEINKYLKIINDNDEIIKQNDIQIINNNKEFYSFEQSYIKLLSKIENKEYCISCYKDEMSNNHLEIRYLKNNDLTKKILSPLAYVYLIFKSNLKEIALNIKLYNALKNSNCFDIGFYLNNNPDLMDSKWCKYFSPELHYICNGFDEQRKFNKKYFNRNSKKELLKYILSCDDDLV